MSTAKELTLRDLDSRAARVLDFVKCLNGFIFIGLVFFLFYLAAIYFDHFFFDDRSIENIQDFLAKRKNKIPVSIKLTDLSTGSASNSGPETASVGGDAKTARTTKTSYTLSSSELEKLTNKNIESKWYKDEVDGNKDELCGLCGKKYKPKDKIKRLSCDHYFHASCLIRKIKKNVRSCNVCGQDFTDLLVGQEAYKEEPISPLKLISEKDSSSAGLSIKTNKTKNVTINTPGTTDFYNNYYPGPEDYDDEMYEDETTAN